MTFQRIGVSVAGLVLALVVMAYGGILQRAAGFGVLNRAVPVG